MSDSSSRPILGSVQMSGSVSGSEYESEYESEYISEPDSKFKSESEIGLAYGGACRF